METRYFNWGKIESYFVPNGILSPVFSIAVDEPCPNWKPHRCTDSPFVCYTDDDKCDGHNDCESGEDEVGCSKSGIFFPCLKLSRKSHLTISCIFLESYVMRIKYVPSHCVRLKRKKTLKIHRIFLISRPNSFEENAECKVEISWCSTIPVVAVPPFMIYYWIIFEYHV